MSFDEGGDGDGIPKSRSRPMFANHIPEFRRYGVFVINADSKKPADSNLIMETLCKLIENHDLPNKLQFNQIAPVAEVNGNVLIGCEDEDTAEWITRCMGDLRPPHSTVPYIEFFGLIRCTLVMPEPTETGSGLFSTLENQNRGLVTDKWAITGRSFEGAEDNRSEIMELYIDAESKKLIERQSSTLLYAYTTIRFRFES
ncbi:hypothetical protein KR038_008887 [Drosophila bunnanda]|nr:hypothetical protein KR038_008887 [Drosophila bunnanda]